MLPSSSKNLQYVRLIYSEEIETLYVLLEITSSYFYILGYLLSYVNEIKALKLTLLYISIIIDIYSPLSTYILYFIGKFSYID